MAAQEQALREAAEQARQQQLAEAFNVKESTRVREQQMEAAAAESEAAFLAALAETTFAARTNQQAVQEGTQKQQEAEQMVADLQQEKASIEAKAEAEAQRIAELEAALAAKEQEHEVAALMTVARAFMLRVPSEGIPLAWQRAHSNVVLTEGSATITLARRKNARHPTKMTRKCCCQSTGRELCAVHWLHDLRSRISSGDRLFHFTPSYFNRKVKEYALTLGFEGAARASSHGFRRGMAQDIVDAGGSLATLLKAGGWCSAAYAQYLRDNQAVDVAASHAVLSLSDSEDDK